MCSGSFLEGETEPSWRQQGGSPGQGGQRPAGSEKMQDTHSGPGSLPLLPLQTSGAVSLFCRPIELYLFRYFLSLCVLFCCNISLYTTLLREPLFFFSIYFY